MAAATTVKVNDATDSMLAACRVSSTSAGTRPCATACSTRGSWRSARARPTSVSASCCSSAPEPWLPATFAVGTLALFVAYLGWLSFLPRMVGRMLARRKQADVAVDRMRQLVAGASRQHGSAAHAPARASPARVRAADDRPPRCRCSASRSAPRPASPAARASRDVSFTMDRGSFVVLTGPVGSGKSTLLRAILGLACRPTSSARCAGTARSSRPGRVHGPAERGVPAPGAAARLGLGPRQRRSRAGRPTRLARALTLAAVVDDVAALPDGADTLIGPRGLRLSGGQRQRLATARALVHAPELVVLDDLSSAVDVETELQLWANLAEAGLTVLAVSHRAVAFERADQVLRLDHGTLVGF